VTARAVGGHTSKDWATQMLSSMAVTPRPDAWRLDALEKGATREQSAELARGWLNSNPGIAETLSSNLQGVPLVEQINIVQEALSDAAVDFPKAVQWAAQQQPELAERARLGGSGSFGFEQFQKSYVRKAVLGAVAQLKNAGGDAAPEVMLPAAVSELLANEARVHNPENPNIAGAINRRIGGTTDPIEALWKLDGILSDAASDKLNEGYTNGSLLAEGFFKAASPGDGSRVGAMKERFGGRTNDAYFSSPQIGPTPHEPMASRMPIRIGFSSNVPGAGAALNRNDIATPAEVLHQAINGSGIQLRQDDAEINPAVVGRGASARPSALRTRVSGRNPRAFAVNSILDNEYKALMGKSAEIAAAAKSGQITIEDAKAQRAKIAAQLGGIARRQTLLDATREGNELLLQDANRQARKALARAAATSSISAAIASFVHCLTSAPMSSPTSRSLKSLCESTKRPLTAPLSKTATAKKAAPERLCELMQSLRHAWMSAGRSVTRKLRRCCSSFGRSERSTLICAISKDRSRNLTGHLQRLCLTAVVTTSSPCRRGLQGPARRLNRSGPPPRPWPLPGPRRHPRHRGLTGRWPIPSRQAGSGP